MCPNIGTIHVQYVWPNQGLIAFWVRSRGIATTCRVGDSKLWQVNKSCPVQIKFPR